MAKGPLNVTYTMSNLPQKKKKKKFKEARQGTTPFECTTCDAKFAVKGHSKRNIKSVHEGMKKTKYGAK